MLMRDIPYMVHSRFLSRTVLVLSASLAFCCTSCQEHERITKETEKVLQQVKELEAQRDATDVSTPGTMKQHPIARKGKKALNTAITGLRNEVSAMEERKSALELEVAALQKDFADYRAKNP